jgi:hypothetical protein
MRKTNTMFSLFLKKEFLQRMQSMFAGYREDDFQLIRFFLV